jgi:hypothetical protein
MSHLRSLSFFVAALLVAQTGLAKQPNFVFILVDDK